MDDYREVSFFDYCKKCKYEKLMENEDPCAECLDVPLNEYTNKPYNYEEKETKKRARSI